MCEKRTKDRPRWSREEVPHQVRCDAGGPEAALRNALLGELKVHVEGFLAGSSVDITVLHHLEEKLHLDVETLPGLGAGGVPANAAAGPHAHTKYQF